MQSWCHKEVHRLNSKIECVHFTYFTVSEIVLMMLNYGHFEALVPINLEFVFGWREDGKLSQRDSTFYAYHVVVRAWLSQKNLCRQMESTIWKVKRMVVILFLYVHVRGIYGIAVPLLGHGRKYLIESECTHLKWSTLCKSNKTPKTKFPCVVYSLLSLCGKRQHSVVRDCFVA